MVTKRRPPPTKQPSPPQPPDESSEHEEEEVESDSGKESEEERSGKQSQSKALDDEDDSDEGDDSGEEDSESESEQPTLNRSRSDADAPTVPALATPAVASDDDEDDKGDESGESDSETEEEQPTLNRPRSDADAPTVPAPATPAVASDDDEDGKGDESGESDSETEEEQPAPNPPAPRTATTGKPSNRDSAPESGKDAATPLKTATGEATKKLFQRIWSDVDQMTLLKGMVDYIETEGKDPMANIEGFWLFIRKKLSFPVREWQLIVKIRTVKRKYISNQGKNRAFSKAYDAEVFELSKKVWGAGEKSVAIESGRGKKRKGDELVVETGAVEIGGNDEVEWENETVNLSRKHIGLSEDLARAKIKSMAESERKLLVQSWKKLKADEVSSLLRRTALEFDTLKTIF